MNINLDIDKLKKIKKLGQGMLGTVYLVEDDNKNKYALKIEHIFKQDLIKSTKSKVWRELIFLKEINKLNSPHFMKLYDYKFINDCKHVQKYGTSLDVFPPIIQRAFKKLAESPYCVVKIFDLKDGSLHKILNKLSQKQIYSLIIQMVYAISQLIKYNFIHNDLHAKNIAYTKTNKKYININNYKVPTFGYIYSIIDYGNVLSKKFKLKNREKKDLVERQKVPEIINIYYWFAYHEKFWNYIEKNKIKLDWKNLHKIFQNEPEYQFFKSLKNYKDIMLELWMLFFPQKYQQILSGKNIFFPLNYLIPKEELLYILINVNDPQKIIKYFYEKIKY